MPDAIDITQIPSPSGVYQVPRYVAAKPAAPAEIPIVGSAPYLLADGTWSDTGQWRDSHAWQDS